MRALREERTTDLPFSLGRVWDAASRVFELTQWRVKKADKIAGRYEVLVNIPADQSASPVPLVGKLQVDIISVGANSTKVHAAIRSVQWHWGTTAWHVNIFFTELQRQLSGQG